MLTRPRTWLAIIAVAFVLLATVYSLVTPLFEASDELWHYPMIKYLADHRLALPVQDPANPGPWRQEGSQPPLYYVIGAAATFWIDTSDIDAVRRINPHADIGIVVPDGNANMVVHDDEREDFPWSGTALAMHIVRFLSILMGLGTVILTYSLGRELFPASAAVALAAAAFVAFNPMFLFVSAVINNDNLSTLLATALLVLVVRLVKRAETPPGWRTYALIGVTAGAGMLAKYQIGFMLPLVALALLIVSLRTRDWRPVVVGGAISGGLTILIAGWWYARNYHLYGDATGINVFLDIVGRRAVPADLHQLWTERDAFMMSFWGFFGGVNVPMRHAVYTLFNVLVGFAALGLLYALAREIVSRWRTRRDALRPAANRPLILARLFAVIWPVVVFVSLLSWTRQTWASQGRLWFSAIAALSLWIAVGLASWSPRSRVGALLNLGMAVTVFASIAATAPFTTIRPAYTFDPDATWRGDTLETSEYVAACFSEPQTPDQETLCVAANILDGTLYPGDDLLFSPAMTVKHRMTRDWSIFVHLANQDGTIEAQRDVYPGGGLLATSDLDAGEAWNNKIAVHIPTGIYTPQILDVYLGFYDLASPTFERMPVNRVIADDDRRLYLGQVRLEPLPGDVPNPVSVDFGGKLELQGYEIDDRSLAPGSDMTITLFWRGLVPMTGEYVVSVQVIDPDPARLTKAAQEDRPPVPPTTTWTPGETVTDSRTLTVFPDAPPGRYRVMVVVYPADNPAGALRIRTGTGGQSEDFVWLSWIQVEAP